MSDSFFARPILNSPYACPRRHWELDPSGQPTQRIVENRRRAEFVTPIPKPKKRKTAVRQDAMVFADGQGLSTAAQQYGLRTTPKRLKHFDQFAANDRRLGDKVVNLTNPAAGLGIAHTAEHILVTAHPTLHQ